jgi:flagellar basal body-associated protein FliL
MGVTMLVFELDAIYMEEKMSKLKGMLAKKPLLWLVILVVLLVTAATVYAVLPAISLNSPTSFPVDI